MENLQDKFGQVQNQEYSALKLSLEIREVESQLKKLKEMVSVYVINELDNNGEPINEGNFTFTKSTARTFFDYSGNPSSGTLEFGANQVSLFPILPSITWNFKF